MTLVAQLGKDQQQYAMYRLEETKSK